jgi:hypothetical protein
MTVKKYIMILGGLFIVIVIAAFTTVFLWGVYQKHWDTPLVRAVSNIIPIPVARVGNELIPMSQYFRDVDNLKTYLASDEAKASGQGVRSLTDDDRKQAIEREIEEIAIDEYAAQKKITLTDKEVESAIDTQFVGASSTRQDLEKQLKLTYGWSMDDFREHIARPILLERKLATLVNATDTQMGMTDVISTLTTRIQKPDVVRYLKF